MRRLLLIGILVAAGAAGIVAQPAGRRSSPDRWTGKVKDNLFVITGGGGNTAAFVTAGGVVLVDTKLAGWGERIMQQVRLATDKPVTMIVNTHTHGDHVGSNDFFPASVDVVAHANTKTNMEKMPAFAGDKSQFLPDRTYYRPPDDRHGRRSHRTAALRSRPHQRRHHRGVSGAARRAHR